jgi:hypothetical protein
MAGILIGPSSQLSGETLQNFSLFQPHQMLAQVDLEQNYCLFCKGMLPPWQIPTL